MQVNDGRHERVVRRCASFDEAASEDLEFTLLATQVTDIGPKRMTPRYLGEPTPIA